MHWKVFDNTFGIFFLILRKKNIYKFEKNGMLLLSHLTNKAEQASLKLSTCLFLCVLELLESLTERNEEMFWVYFL